MIRKTPNIKSKKSQAVVLWLKNLFVIKDQAAMSKKVFQKD
jgi:hypothetical protein